MSSLRNAVQRRNHRERDQPEERKKWGLLEKRKDYKLRAADHKSKQAKIKALSQKASERNEDEFYFGMVNAQSRGGVKVAKRGAENGGGTMGSLDVDTVKLMKTQDLGYLRTQLQRVRNEKARLEREVVVAEVGVDVDGSGNGRRKVFVENGEEGVPALPEPLEQDDGDLNMDLDGLGDLSEGESDDDEGEDLTPEERALRQRKRHALEVRQRKLDALEEQEEKLNAALQAVEHQRAKMNGTIGGVNKNGQKFKIRQRKRKR
ncbi:U3 small nucleolar RNA-associated protein 11 [Pseudocercospora fuligena]|uniref:U3 small nucleolar RNA-associated protein 11 n=1 Tax=Pseudocercospora fuligena TaxID=685502 RepID=A0A8H6VMQ0_9PEZI|nr:U3 small nucleolar RNA-associated protein 11 [Pseudocercospora fuligena]